MPEALDINLRYTEQLCFPEKDVCRDKRAADGPRTRWLLSSRTDCSISPGHFQWSRLFCLNSLTFLPSLLLTLPIPKLIQVIFKQNETSVLLIISWQGKTPVMAAGLWHFCFLPSWLHYHFFLIEFSISLASLSYSWPVQVKATSTLTLCFWALLLQTCCSKYSSQGRKQNRHGPSNCM